MEGESQISVHHFLTHNAEKNTGTLRCFTNLGYRKFLGIRQGAGLTISCQNGFLSHYRNVSYSNPPVLCFRKIPLAKKFMDKRGGGLVVQRVSFEDFLTHSPQKKFL